MFFSCDFEMEVTSDSLCHISQDHADDFDWILQSNITPSAIGHNRKINKTSYPVTGPSGPAQGEYYVFIEASKKNISSFAR